eukprot:scaffold23204_cov39-Attheya_sp.AAC.1
MNTYNHAASIAVGSNSNANIGEIRVVFYATTYSTKHTQEDDEAAFKRVVDSYIRRSLKRKADEEAKEEEDRTEEGNDAKEGFHNMYVAILRNCQAH